VLPEAHQTRVSSLFEDSTEKASNQGRTVWKIVASNLSKFERTVDADRIKRIKTIK
jgi:ribosomal protein L18E